MKRRAFFRGLMVSGAATTLAACAGVPAPRTSSQTTPAAGAPAAAPQAAAPQAAAPAQGSDLPQLNWQMPTSWTPAIDVLLGAATSFGTRVGELTQGRFTITAAPAGQIVPGLQVYDAIEAGTAPIGHTASFYWVGRDPAWGIGTALPFGLTTMQQNAWLYAGGGREALGEFYAENGIVAFPAGNTTQQMGGWFKREVNTVADLQGLKMRIPGIGGQVMNRLGVVPQVLAGGEIFQALSSGTIDAAEFIGPVEEEKLGFQKAAEFYYYPGWWEPAATLDVFVSKAEYDKLPKLYQSAIQVAAAESNITSIARYDAANQAAIARLEAGGTKLRPFSTEIMAAAQKAAFELYEENSAKSPAFKKIFEGWRTFRTEIQKWHKTNDFAFQDFIYKNPAA